ncbi:MAG: hypothetical protein COA78_14405 [Blastopirellula sp.]|nr:MAG: hypothetical protein COA78_14405 [Blastopirellula sp.]
MKSSQPSHILIVEDEHAHAILMRRAFEDVPDQYQVVIASTLAEARDEIAKKLPDLVLVDLCLPDGRGLELLEGSDDKSLFPVVVMTSYGNEVTAVESLKSGAIDYVVKTGHMIPELPRIAARVLSQWNLKLDKQATELALRNSERRYRALIENSPVCIVVHCNDTIFLANDEAIRCLGGQNAEEVIGRSIKDFVFEEERPSFDDHISQATKNLQSAPKTEQRFKKIDGSSIDVEIVSTAIDFHGKPGTQSVFQDITKRKQSEITLRTHDRALAAASNGIFIVELPNSQKPKVVYCNSAFQAITGLKLKEISEQGFNFWNCDTRDQDDLDLLQQSMQQGEYHSISVRLLDENETTIWCELSISPVRDEQGLLTHAVGIVNNVTEKVLAEEQVRQRNSELAHVARLSTLGEIVAGIAHEVNQPLYAILNYAGTCSNLIESNGAKQIDDVSLCISRIIEQSTRAGEIIRRLRDFSRRSEPRFEPTQFENLVSEVLELLAPILYHDRVTVKCELPKDLSLVLVDAIQVEQVLTNLVTNACDSMRGQVQDKVITIHAQQIETDIEVSVSDTGAGLPNDVDFFEAFSTTKAGGMGMGLAISRRIIEIHGGKIWAKPHVPHGAVFYFTLPVQLEDSNEHVVSANHLHH